MQAEEEMTGLLKSYLEANRIVKFTGKNCPCVNEMIRSEIFLHELDREYTFRVMKGKRWHQDLCIQCAIKHYVGGEVFKTVNIPNIRGCTWIIFEEKKSALYFAKEISSINMENLIVIRELPSPLKELIAQINNEERWCPHDK